MPPDDLIASRATALLHRHLRGADGVGLYDPAIVARQIGNAAAPWGSMTIVLMRPAEFLALAAPIFHEHELAPDDPRAVFQADKLDSIAHGLANGGLNNLPFLGLTAEGPDALRVSQHEGRHRALTAQRRGVERFPVQLLVHDAGDRPDNARWPLMLEPPTLLLGEAEHRDNAVAMPELPVTAATLDLDPAWAVAMGAACNGVGAVLWGRDAPDVDHPAAHAAFAWGLDQGREMLRWFDDATRWSAVRAFADQTVEQALEGQEPIGPARTR